MPPCPPSSGTGPHDARCAGYTNGGLRRCTMRRDPAGAGVDRAGRDLFPAPITCCRRKGGGQSRRTWPHSSPTCNNNERQKEHKAGQPEKRLRGRYRFLTQASAKPAEEP